MLLTQNLRELCVVKTSGVAATLIVKPFAALRVLRFLTQRKKGEDAEDAEEKY